MEELIFCEKCIEVFSNKKELLEHKCEKKIEKENNIKKIFINEENNSNNNEEQNIKIQKNRKKYVCELCNVFETDYKNNYYRHKKKYCKKITR